MRIVLITGAVLTELFLWFALGFTYDPIERLVERVTFYAGAAVIGFALFVPVLTESDSDPGVRKTLDKISSIALGAFIFFALIGALVIANAINWFSDAFVTGEYFAR